MDYSSAVPGRSHRLSCLVLRNFKANKRIVWAVGWQEIRPRASSASKDVTEVLSFCSPHVSSIFDFSARAVFLDPQSHNSLWIDSLFSITCLFSPCFELFPSMFSSTNPSAVMLRQGHFENLWLELSKSTHHALAIYGIPLTKLSNTPGIHIPESYHHNTHVETSNYYYSGQYTRIYILTMFGNMG